MHKIYYYWLLVFNGQKHWIDSQIIHEQWMYKKVYLECSVVALDQGICHIHKCKCSTQSLSVQQVPLMRRMMTLFQQTSLLLHLLTGYFIHVTHIFILWFVFHIILVRKFVKCPLPWILNILASHCYTTVQKFESVRFILMLTKPAFIWKIQ